jgi:hypothetical protein
MVKRATLLRLCSMPVKATFFSDRSRARAKLNQFRAIMRVRGSPSLVLGTSAKLPRKFEFNFYRTRRVFVSKPRRAAASVLRIST